MDQEIIGCFGGKPRIMDRHEKTEISVAVLAGGASRRMGTNKSLVDLAGKPLIQHTLDCVRRLNTPVFLVTNSPDQYRRIPGCNGG